MRTRQKIRLDRLLGAPLVWSLAAMRFLLGKRRTRLPVPPKTVVVAKFVGLGSIIQADRLLRMVNAAWPDAEVVFLSSRANRELLERLRSVDRVICIDDSSVGELIRSTVLAIGEIRKLRPELFFDLEVYSNFGSLVCSLSAASTSCGLYRYDSFPKRWLYDKLLFFNTRVPIGDIYTQIGLAAGADSKAESHECPLELQSTDERELSRCLPELAGSEWRSFVLVNPNASDLLLERQWPRKNFAELIEQITASGWRVLLSGARSEQEYVSALYRMLSEGTRQKVLDTSGRLELPAFLLLLSRAACVITVDSGPMHMAFALGRPTVCLFGPGTPDHYGASGARVRTLYKRVYCSPCLYETEEPPCGGNNACMQLIRVDEVYEAFQSLMSAEHSEKAHESGSNASLRLYPDGLPLGVFSGRARPS